MGYPATRGYYFTQCTANATSYPASPSAGVTGNATATAGNSVTQNSTRVLIHSVYMSTATGSQTVTIQNHAGTVTYAVFTGSAVPSGCVLDMEIPSGFRCVSSAAGVQAIITYLPLD